MSPINEALFNTHFQLLGELVKKIKSKEKAAPYMRALSEMFIIHNDTVIENRELKLKHKLENNALYRKLKTLSEENKTLKDKLNKFDKNFK